MSSIVKRTAVRSAFRAAPRVSVNAAPRRFAWTSTAEERRADTEAVKEGARRDPELYVCPDGSRRASESFFIAR